jgi:N-acylneuraminate cytidylyltransferase/CMP-N,N'-diacetyllegionaminic acid synthase
VTSICIVCARGGSKGVPHKNVRPLLGKPLIAWTIEQAKASKLFELVAVSSDASSILEIARAAGADLLVDRPDELATDTASVLPAILHCLHAAETALGHECKTLVYLQATSPTRRVDDIRHAVALFQETHADAVVSGQAAKCSPYFNIVEMAADGSVHLSKPLDPSIVRRQDAPACFQLNGSIYVWRRDLFCAKPMVFYSNTRIFVMPEERSIDIDSELDFALAELVLSGRAGTTLTRTGS